MKTTLFSFYKSLLAALLLFISVAGWGQATLYSTNFGTNTSLVTGWSSSSTSSGWNASTSSASSTYTGASGGSNIVFNGTGTNGITHTLTYNNNLSTVGYTNITLLWGGRGTSTFNGDIIIEWSSNGTTWNKITYAYTKNGNAWALVNSGNRISLPSGAEEVSNLQFRFSAAATNNGNYRIDDFSVQGTATPTCAASTVSSTVSAVNNSTSGVDFSGSITNAGGGTNITERGFQYPLL
ncbi:hypothetical protein [Kaistella sp.]|uniref:hypothetical protein n=1 Tax=Kaistella sp. TaxID=2782235 RepID=UPI002F930FD9